jgi:ABC-type amino acid transport system permease subunit
VTTTLWTSIWGTVVLWTISGALAMGVGLVLAAVSLSGNRLVRFCGQSVINVTRGIPTALLVIAAGLATIRLPAKDLPVVFPGTLAPFQQIAWAITIALALGSAGHLAMIFRASREALGSARLQQANVLGLSRLRRARVLMRESAPIALAPTGSRLVHHLHNTAFAALFPVTDVFGYVQGQANATFEVFDYALLGCVVYIVLSALIWTLFRGAEASLVRGVAKAPKAKAVLA